MALANAAEQSLRNGNPEAALSELQDAVRASPSEPKLRVFLFQLLALLGQWERALNQLDVVASLDAGALAMAEIYRGAVRCEMLRAQVFEGKKSPMVFGEPEQWLALLIESLLLKGNGRNDESAAMHERAFDEAPTSPGSVDGRAFEWIADGDMRLGPVLEAIINGRYYWVPFTRLTRIVVEPPSDLRDSVWMPAHLDLDNGGEAYALIPTRYAGSEKSGDAQIVLAKKTSWEEAAPDLYLGLGQRVFATDAGEISLMDAREISLTAAAAGGPA